MTTLLKMVGLCGSRRRLWSRLLTASGLGLLAATVCPVQGTQPLVAIHDSEYTRALENQNASGATPIGSGTTGKQWWPTDWHYFVMPEAIKEALRSDGTAFTVVGDSNVIAGALLTNGMPKYPIVISLASEAIHDSEIAPFTNYVAAGGFLFVGSSAFTRNTNGTSRGNFAFANEMGIHMAAAGLTNWILNRTYTKLVDHRIQTHVPAGTINWRLPSASEEIPYGVSPGPLTPHDDAQAQQPHDVWQVVNSNATVLAQGQTSPFLTIRAYGKGYFIYCAAMQPLMGNGGWAPTMYNYLIFRRSIEWAFENAGLPVAKLSPWPYPYDAAFMVRHDLESFSNAIAAVEASAQFEFTNGCTGDYYFCTGTLREDMSPAYNTNDVVAGLRRAMTNYGATIGPHNGGLTNPMIMGTPNSYDYWHWGTDEVLDITPPPGYSSGSNYAYVSMLRSFQNIESWLPGLMTNGMRVWCGPYYNSTREASLNIQAQLGVKITGEQKVAPFPHWSLSTQTPDKRFGILQQPPSDWFVGSDISHSIEAGHTIGTLRGGIDYYYNLGALINFYSHTLSTGLGRAGPRATEYVTYSMDTNRFPRLWSANAIKIYNWWQQRSNVQMTASITTNGTQINTTFTIRNSVNTNTTIELTPPLSTSFCNLQVFTNGALAGASVYRLTSSTIKIRVGTTVTNVLVSYYPLGGNIVALAENFDAPTAPALPAGWTTSATGVQTPWVAQAANADSPSNSVFVGNPANIGVSELVSPVLAVSAGQAQLTFRNSYDLENGVGGIGYDGGVLEIKIGAGSFTDIITAGGTFISGGYNAVIDNGFASPIAGRPAWSGSSGGYLTTTVSLPVLVTNQNIQLRWRCATDNGGSAGGWRIDSISISNRVCLCCLTGTNTPVLPAQTNRTINELSTLTVTNTATDADVGETLFYALQNPPSGAIISGSGIITWTPSAAFGGTTNPITTIVTDSTDRKATNSFNVIVQHVNTAPVLPVQTNRTINELSTLTVTNTATDSDLPANTLSYSLLVAPGGASISGSGVITWPTTEANGPGNFTFTTRVVDNGVPALSATNTFTVTVNEINSAPTLPGQGNRTINESTALVVTNTASDGDFPANSLSYQLLAPPAGATINSSGIINWTPTESQGPVTNTITTVVTDNGTPNLSATNSFTVVVNEVNSAPIFAVTPTNQTIAELTLLTVTNAATDSDVPTNVLTYALTGPVTATINTNTGVITWTPGEADGPGTNTFTTVVSDGTVSITNSFVVTVTEVNQAPSLPIQTNRTIAELALLTVTNTATDGDLPANTLTYQLVNPPGNAAINASGVITWTPSASEGPGTNIITTVVSDGLASATNNFTVIVTDGNQAPVLPVQTNRAVAELTTLTVTNTASDVNLPTDTLTYSLVNAPSGLSINSNGIITWTPTEAQGPGTYTNITIVTDAGGLSATNSFVITVTEVNQAPVLPAQTNRTIVELALLTVTNTATDGDTPTNTLTYQLINPPSGASINSSGIITWTPTEAQGPGTYTNTTVVSDGTVSVTNSFVVTVTETNQAPVLPAQTNRNIAELTLLTVTNTATDGDSPANILSYSLLVAPPGASISASGIITWTPSETNGPGNHTFTTRVVDNGSPTLSATNTFNVTVTEVNVSPVLPAQTNRTIAELTQLIVTNTATDADLPANILTYQLLNPPGNAAINASGIITWTPQENEGPATNTITTVVNDGNVSVTNSFVVIVTEDNQAPVLPVPSDRIIPELALLTVTNTASDTDLPANALTYQLLNPPGDATITTNGIITWLPQENEGPGTNVITTVVSDGTASVTNSFTVIVTEVNQAPVFVAQTNRTIAELSQLVVTNAATDGDLPTNTLTYTLLTAPGGATVDPNEGVITWTTTESDGGTTNVFTAVVTDGSLSATNSFQVIVLEVNQAPILPAQTNRSVAELTLLTVTNTATDNDLPANSLTYELLSPPGNAAISTNGIITWTPQENEGPASRTITTVVNDGTTSATNSFVVTVTEVNQPPALSAQTNYAITELELLVVTNAATDADLPANTLAYQLLNPPAHARISASGVISWKPAVNQGGTTNVITTVVSDGSASATNSFSVAVIDTLNGLTTNVMLISTGAVWSYLDNGSNQGTAWRDPGFDASSWSNGPAQFGFGDGDEQTIVSFGTNSSAKYITTYFRKTFTIADRNFFSVLPARVIRDDGIVIYLNGTEIYRNNLPQTAIGYQTLALGAIGGADETNFVNVLLSAESLFNGTNLIAVEIHQNSASSSDLSFDLELVGALNLITPALPAQTNRTIPELTTLSVTNTALDLDTLPDGLTYQLVNAPGNAAIDAAGVITWTPQENEGPANGTIITVVSDGMFSVTNTFEVTVTEVNQPPVLPVQTNRTIAELALLTVTNTATDGDLPANTLTYQLINPPVGANIDVNGIITWTPTEAQGPGTYTNTTVVSDGTVSVTNSFTVTVTEVNQPPVLPAQTNRTVAELTLLTVTNTATDGDLPANTLTYQLLAAPVGINISANGVISWTPGETAGPGTNTITTVVTDGTVSVTNSFLVIVTEANTPPALDAIANRTVHAGSLVAFTATATDADLPAQQLSFSLINTPPAGASIDSSSGLFEWLTSNVDVNTTNTVTVRVADPGTPVLSTNRSFVITVIARPQIAAITRTNGGVAVTWSSIAGQQYRLQRTDTLQPTNWQDVGANVTATGNFTTQTNATAGVEMRFYRIRLAP